MSQVENVEQSIIQFLHNRIGADRPVTPESDLLTREIADGDLCRNLAAFVEDQFGIVLTESDLSPQHLRTVGCLARLLVSKMIGGDAAAIRCQELDAFRSLSNRFSRDG